MLLQKDDKLVCDKCNEVFTGKIIPLCLYCEKYFDLGRIHVYEYCFPSCLHYVLIDEIPRFLHMNEIEELLKNNDIEPPTIFIHNITF